MSDRPSSSEKLASTPFNKKLSLFHETRGRPLRINRKSQNTLAVIEKTNTRRVGMVRYFSSSIRGCIRLRSSDSWLDRQVFINLTPILIASAFLPPLAGWWVINMGKPASSRATNLSVLGLFASILVESTSYLLPINRGILYFVFQGCTLVCFAPGMLCAFYYLGLCEPDGPM